MNIIILGANGFVGTNLTIELTKNKNNHLALFGRNLSFFKNFKDMHLPNVKLVEQNFEMECDFEAITKGQDVVYHLISTTFPTMSNEIIPQEMMGNVVVTSKLLEACVKNKVKKVVLFPLVERFMVLRMRCQ